MELGFIIFFSLVIAGFAARFVPGKNLGISGDLLFGLFGAFVGMNLALTLGHFDLLNGFEPVVVLATWGGSFLMVAVTRIYSLLPNNQRVRHRN